MLSTRPFFAALRTRLALRDTVFYLAIPTNVRNRSARNSACCFRVGSMEFLLVCSSGSEAVDAVSGRHVPLVFADRIPEKVSGDAVCADNIETARVATWHLIELGHRQIALLAGDLGLSPHAERLEGFCHAMRQAGFSIQEEYLCAGGARVEDSRRSAVRLLDSRSRPQPLLKAKVNSSSGCYIRCGSAELPYQLT